VDAQIELAEELLRMTPGQLNSTPRTPNQNLMPLHDLSEAELIALADAVVSPERQEQVGSLLQEIQLGDLNSSKQVTLDAILEEVDQVALLKARALYTLSLRRSPS
jgi:hypothetical protein